ncbi:MAG: membrane protein insertion efficiency factor YidD [Bdellovibrio sp.]|nr:MAG: membrane protein insertion efficiency factor YidD [Bdellovibrio sp.]
MNLKKAWITVSTSFVEIVKKMSLVMIFVYRGFFSLWFGGQCRFQPSCSCFAEEAFSIHPPLVALRLTLVRLSRCRPRGGYGWDPVPQSGHHGGAKNEG